MRRSSFIAASALALSLGGGAAAEDKKCRSFAGLRLCEAGRPAAEAAPAAVQVASLTPPIPSLMPTRSATAKPAIPTLGTPTPNRSVLSPQGASRPTSEGIVFVRVGLVSQGDGPLSMEGSLHPTDPSSPGGNQVFFGFQRPLLKSRFATVFVEAEGLAGADSYERCGPGTSSDICMTSSLKNIGLFGNIRVEMNPDSPLRPYASAGTGPIYAWGSVELDDGVYTSSESDSDGGWGYQGRAGLLAVIGGVRAEVGYRHMGGTLDSQNFEAHLIEFGGTTEF